VVRVLHNLLCPQVSIFVNLNHDSVAESHYCFTAIKPSHAAISPYSQIAMRICSDEKALDYSQSVA
jgi:hypothetical protein